MKSIRYILGIFLLVSSGALVAQICPDRVICKTRFIESCYPVAKENIPLCDNHHQHYCWKIMQLPYGKLSSTNVYDRPPLNDMCYYLNHCGYYNIILSYQGRNKFGL